MGADSGVSTITLQPDGKILIGGYFTEYNGTTANYIARLNADGTLEHHIYHGDGSKWICRNHHPPTRTVKSSSVELSPHITAPQLTALPVSTPMAHWTRHLPQARVQTILFALPLSNPNGKILISGDFTTYNGTTANRIARLNSDGTLDTTFITGTGANSGVNTITLQPDGKILIGGYFTKYNNTTANRIARLNADGTLDTTFTTGTGVNGYIETTTLQPERQNSHWRMVHHLQRHHSQLHRPSQCRRHTDTTFTTGTGAGGDVYHHPPTRR